MALPPSRLHRTDRLCQHGSARQLRCDSAAKLLSAVWQSRRLYLAPAELLSRRKRGRFLSGGPARARLSLLELPEVERESVWARVRDFCFGSGCVVDLYGVWGHCGGASRGAWRRRGGPRSRAARAAHMGRVLLQSSGRRSAPGGCKRREPSSEAAPPTLHGPTGLLYRALRDAALRARQRLQRGKHVATSQANIGPEPFRPAGKLPQAKRHCTRALRPQW